MELKDKILMVEQMIRENRDATVRDYLELLQEVESIEQETEKFEEKKMPKVIHTHNK